MILLEKKFSQYLMRHKIYSLQKLWHVQARHVFLPAAGPQWFWLQIAPEPGYLHAKFHLAESQYKVLIKIFLKIAFLI